MLPLQTHAQAWCDTDWLNRKKITVSNTNVDSDLTDFSLLINITDSDLSSVANSDGLDIFFTEETTCDKLKWEKEAYTSGTGALVAWVKVPTITAAANTILYMYYGNSGAADQTDFENVWTSDYKLVLHMEEDPSITTDGECGGGSVNFCDSTSNNNDGNASGTMVSGNLVPVQVSQGIDFDGDDDHFFIEHNTSLEEGLETTGFTGSFWIKFDDFNNGDDPSIIDKSDGNVFMLGLNGSTDDETRFRLNVGASTKTLPSADDSAFGVNASTWYYIVHAYGGTQPNGLRTYIDGIEVGSTTDSGTINMPSTGATHIAERADDAGQNIDGIIDELRLSNTGHTEEWIKFEYHSQKITAGTITLAAQDSPPVTGGRSQPSFYFISKEVTDITSDSAVVSWNTSIPTDTQLNWSSSLKES